MIHYHVIAIVATLPSLARLATDVSLRMTAVLDRSSLLTFRVGRIYLLGQACCFGGLSPLPQQAFLGKKLKRNGNKTATGTWSLYPTGAIS